MTEPMKRIVIVTAAALTLFALAETALVIYVRTRPEQSQAIVTLETLRAVEAQAAKKAPEKLADALKK
jgi:hypothetical protein